MASNNTLSVVLDIIRTAVGRGEHTFKFPRTLSDLKQLQIVEQQLTANAAGVSVNFGPLTKADAVFFFTPRKVGVHLNAADAPVVHVGSGSLLLDTNITSITLDNNVEGTPTDITVEVWLVQL